MKNGQMAKKSVNTLVTALLAVLIMLVPLGSMPALAADPKLPKVHPQLAKMAGENPDQMVRVLVQSAGKDDSVSAEIDRRGGKDKKHLSLIHGLAAEMTAQAAVDLAKQPDVKWLTIDAPMASTVVTDSLGTVYPLAVEADKVWNAATAYTGTGVGVAVLDSGINNSGATNGKDFGNRIVAKANMTSGADLDQYGHGTHVAGIIGSSGAGSRGKYIGIAPNVKLLNVKVSNDQGKAYLSDVVEGLQWVVQNRAKYNIRVVNISLVSTFPESYLTSPLDAAVELTWLSGIVVVVSAGNYGPDSMLYAPANDPLVITVGAADNNATVGIVDDLVSGWSSYGKTQDGFYKPEVVAPGRQIVSNRVGSSVLAAQMPDRIVDKNYLRLSGTSMAAPVVSGIAALILQAHPTWTPDQVKSALMETARPLALAGGTGSAGKGEVDALAAISVSQPNYANQGIALNAGVAGAAGTANYDSATWNSATWNSATWNSATWNSATWNSATWNSATWNSATWNSATWNSAYPD